MSNKRNTIRLLFLGILLLFPLGMYAQFAYQPPKRQPVKLDTLNVMQRLAVRTNMVDWMLLLPNIGVEFDLSGMPYSKLSVLAEGRYNIPSMADHSVRFSIADARLEIRSYWHNRNRQAQNKYKNIFDRVLSHERFKARTWRTYYVGLYGRAGTYNIKMPFVETGFQGTVYQAGLSYGLQRSMYQFGGHALELEIGGSLGVGYASGDKYKVVEGVYRLVERKEGLVFPLPSVNVSLVYRFGPAAKNRYRYNTKYHIWLDEQRTIRQNYLDSLDRAIWNVSDTIFYKRYDRIEEIIDQHGDRMLEKDSKRRAANLQMNRRDSLANDTVLTKVQLKVKNTKERFQVRKQKAEAKWKATSPEKKLERKNEKAAKKREKEMEKENRKAAQQKPEQEVARPEQTANEEAEE